MAIKLRLKTTTGAGSAILAAGELAVNTFDRTLYVGDGSSNLVLLGAPVPAGTAADNSLRWNNSTKEWVENSILKIKTTGPELAASGVFGILTGGAINFNSGIGKIDNTASIFRFTVADAATVDFIDSGQTRMKLRTDGNVEFGGTTIYTDGTEYNKGYQRMEVLTQSAYDLLTPDANTVYFISAS